MDLANAIAPSSRKIIVGTRPGEKIHEEMITSADSFNTFDLGDCYVILPSNWRNIKSFQHYSDLYKKVEDNFNYDSSKNSDFLNVEVIRDLIKKNIDPNFVPL